jgi:hypothetical protein
MWRKTLDEDELPWMRRRVGVEGRAGVDIMQKRPWGVERVKDDIVGVE